MRKYVETINRVLEVKPDDMTVTMHICRGDFRSTWFSSGGYEPVAEVLFGGCDVDGSFLEYVPLDRLCLSPQCGFSSTEEENLITDRDH